MRNNFTHEDLIAHLYKEASVSLTLSIDEALHADPLLASEYAELRESKRQLPQVKFGAPKRILRGILHYSQLTALEQEA